MINENEVWIEVCRTRMEQHSGKITEHTKNSVCCETERARIRVVIIDGNSCLEVERKRTYLAIKNGQKEGGWGPVTGEVWKAEMTDKNKCVEVLNDGLVLYERVVQESTS